MHSSLNAFLLLTLIISGLLLTFSPLQVRAAPAPVNVGIRVWNFNSSRNVPNAAVTLMNQTVTPRTGTTNQTGWVNMSSVYPGVYTLQIKLDGIVVYTNTTFNVASSKLYYPVRSTNVTDYAFILSDSLNRVVGDTQVALSANSSTIASSISFANGSAILRNIPFSKYNLTLTRQQVFISNSTVAVDSTTYGSNKHLSIPTYSFALTVKDYTGGATIQEGSVQILDWGIPSPNNQTLPLSGQIRFSSLWPGAYWVIVTSMDSAIWKSLVTLKTNTTETINAAIGYSITLRVVDVLSRPVSSLRVFLIHNGASVTSSVTDANGVASFTGLPDDVFLLNMTILGRSYTARADLNGTSFNLQVEIDSVFIIGDTPFEAAPLAASITLILTIVAVFSTYVLLRSRTPEKASETEDKKSKR